MMRRVAIAFGLAWTLILAWFLFSEIAAYFRSGAWPPWDAMKSLSQVALLQGSLAFICFAVAAALGSAADLRTRHKDAEAS